MWKSIAAILARIGSQFGETSSAPATMRAATGGAGNKANGPHEFLLPETESTRLAKLNFETAKKDAQIAALELAKEEAEASRAAMEARDAESDAAKSRAQAARVRLKEARYAVLQAAFEMKQAKEAEDAAKANQPSGPSHVSRRLRDRIARQFRNLRHRRGGLERQVAIRRGLQNVAQRGSIYLRALSKRLPSRFQGLTRQAAKKLRHIGSRSAAGRKLASRLSSGLARMGTWGKVAAIGTIAAVAMERFAKTVLEANRAFERFNGTIQRAFAQLDRDRLIRSRQSGAARASSSSALADSVSNMERAWRPVMDFLANAMNRFAAVIAEILTPLGEIITSVLTILRPLFDLLGGVLIVILKGIAALLEVISLILKPIAFVLDKLWRVLAWILLILTAGLVDLRPGEDRPQPTQWEAWIWDWAKDARRRRMPPLPPVPQPGRGAGA